MSAKDCKSIDYSHNVATSRHSHRKQTIEQEEEGSMTIKVTKKISNVIVTKHNIIDE